jgi:hypothetical protein
MFEILFIRGDEFSKMDFLFLSFSATEQEPIERDAFVLVAG